jgi:hypothetical protein
MREIIALVERQPFLAIVGAAAGGPVLVAVVASMLSI